MVHGRTRLVLFHVTRSCSAAKGSGGTGCAEEDIVEVTMTYTLRIGTGRSFICCFLGDNDIHITHRDRAFFYLLLPG